jgi:predicted RNA-binding Zn ribbon-like protein
VAIANDFRFIGRLCLDFAQTGDMGWGSRYERLTTSAELQRWLLLSPLKLAVVKISNEDLQRAKLLRRAIWRVSEALLAGSAPRPRDIQMINRTASQPCLVRELESGATSMRWRQPTAAAALTTIAQDAVLLFGDPVQRARLRRCENSPCRVIFYDDSRPGLRRWCASTRCGDRVRTRHFRQRMKA